MKKLFTSLAALLALSSAAFAQVPVNPPAGGLTQATADARYCALAGCTMVGNISLPANGTLFFGAADASHVKIIASGAQLFFNLADNSGGTSATANNFISAGTARANDAVAVAAGGTNTGFLFSSTANFGLVAGSGVPTISMARGTLYLRSDGLPYYNTNGTTGWDQLAGLAAANTFSAAQAFTSSITVTSGSIAVDTPALTATQTWNAGGTTFKPIFLNVTNTASNANSRLIDLQVASSSKFQVDVSGNGTFASAVNSNAGTSGFVNITTSGSIASASNISQTAGTTFYTGATSGTDTYTVGTPALTAYTTGACYHVRIGTTNTSTTPTININSVGAKTIVKRASTAVAAGDLVGSAHYIMCYQGTNMQVLNPTVP